MNFEPLDTQPIEARIRDQVNGLRLVAGAADYAAVQGLGDVPAPSAYVLLATETPGQAGPMGARAVPAVAQFGVVLALRNWRDQTGGEMGVEARGFIGQVRAALIGWTPPAAGIKPTAWAGGGVMAYQSSTMLWIETYRCTHVLQR